jgi:glycosyltransferase involved in cell wall biosynthesis
MSRRIKVLQLQPDYNVKRHDFADLAEQIVLSLPPERYEVVSAYLKGRPAADEPVSRAERSVYFDFTDAQLKGARLGALWRLYRFCREERFDVAICNRFKPVNMMLVLNRWLKVPACIGIAHNLGDYDRSYRRHQVRRLADRHWRFVGVSPAVRKNLLDLDCGFIARNTVAITNAIDIEQAQALLLEREDARRELGLDPAARVVGTIGRQVPVKGYPHLIRAFARVATRYPDAVLVLIGDGREAARLRDEVMRLGLAGRVHLPGARPYALRYVRAFDLWVMPSLEEGFPLALLEAMSGRLPVIASDIPSMHDLVAGAGGQLVPPADEAALAAALDAHLAMPAQILAHKGVAAYEYLCAHHDIGDYRRAYRSLIDETLAANSRSPA